MISQPVKGPQVVTPNEYLIKAARAIKQQLMLASQLEAEIGNERLHNFDIHIISFPQRLIHLGAHRTKYQRM
ncbi:MAG: hypothetical protein ACR2PX_18470 [Endozoicomonas sp.]|uniref:hypothetical protein n=1 Tax=Endozoicomonas sp. TaxID=1892382 RepID=UPI003D9BF9F8